MKTFKTMQFFCAFMTPLLVWSVLKYNLSGYYCYYYAALNDKHLTDHEITGVGICHTPVGFRMVCIERLPSKAYTYIA